MKLTRIPTGIESLDNIIEGGLPSGSLVLLLGEPGAAIPKKVIYITFTRSQDDIMKEIAFSFPDYYELLEKNIQQHNFEFKDFSDSFFAGSFIPATWLSSSAAAPSIESLKWSEEKK